MRPAAAALIVLAAVEWCTGCASQGMPPGGPPDTAPPTLKSVSPESGSVHVTPRAVEFHFSEIVSERPRGAQGLPQLVVISPSDGAAQVSWARDRIVVRPRSGWRPNTAYAVTVLAGLTDLRGNFAAEPFRTVFSTGPSIPNSTLRGNAFDWMAGRPAPGARIEATIRGDTALKWAIAADSLGRYTLGSLPADTFLVRGWIDTNNNGVRDTREPWDTTTVALRDSARAEFYAFAHDTIGARISEVTIADSVTLRLRFDHGLRPAAPLEGATIQLMRARDSSVLVITSAMPAAAHDSLQRVRTAARADSAARADTSAAARRARAQADSVRLRQRDDSVAKAQMASVRAARDTVKVDPPPTLARPVPPTEFVIIVRDPLPEDVPLRIVARDVQALMGPRRTTERSLTRRSTATRDSTASKRPQAIPPSRPPR